MMENKPYEICCSKSTFDVVKTDERFLCIVTLARLVNALRFIQKVGIDGMNLNNYVGIRSKINSIFFSASILYEGFLLVEKFGKNLRNLDSFKNGFGILFRDNKIKKFRKTVLKKVRNKFVFHFDQKIVKESLENIDLPEYKFATGIGNSVGGMVFVLADEVVINYILQTKPNDSNEILVERYNIILNDIFDVMGKFLKASENLMADVLRDLGFKIKCNE